MILQIFEDILGQWRVRLRAANGRILMSSEAYYSKRDAKRAAWRIYYASRQNEFVVREVKRNGASIS